MRRYSPGRLLGQFLTLPEVMAGPAPNVPLRNRCIADAIYVRMRETPQPTITSAGPTPESVFAGSYATINLNVRSSTVLVAIMRSIVPAMATESTTLGHFSAAGRRSVTPG